MVAALRNIAALALLTTLAGATLAWFAAVTEEDVAGNRLEAQTRIFRELAGVDVDALAEGEVALCVGDIIVLRSAGRGYGGELRLAVALGRDGAIRGVRVLEHAETPGFADILDADSPWLHGFPDGEVHAVTGATVTSDAVIAAVSRAVERARSEAMCP